ncbi:MAG: hypothetical protein RI988_3029 [Pseudomonadota bacterium]|jgi:competence protein ComEA
MIPSLRAWLLAGCLALAGTLPAAAVPAAIDVNKASQAELETVKGIGPAMSSKILAARKSGEFKSWDDLMQRVSGMGPGNARRMSQAGLRVAGSAFQNHAAAAPKAKQAREDFVARGARPDKGEAEARRGKAKPSPAPAGAPAAAVAAGSAG